MKICGIPIVFDERLVALHAQARGFWPFKRIVVGPGWYQLPAEERAAILYHEARHCLSLHMEQRVLLLPFMLAAALVSKICHAQEVECDRFAARHGFGPDMAAMLERYKGPGDMFYPSSSERVQLLRQHQGETS